MGQKTGIEWCDHTFNPWRGCKEVSARCAHCYAKRMAKRNPSVLGQSGADTEPVMAADTYMEQLAKSNGAARRAGVKKTVFCLSMGDFWEKRPDLRYARQHTLGYILACESLVFLVLTKRVQNAYDFFHGGHRDYVVGHWNDPLIAAVAKRIWLGASICTRQQEALDNIATLTAIPCRGHFVSVEPMLASINLGFQDGWRSARGGGAVYAEVLGNTRFVWPGYPIKRPGWIICGGETGPKARPLNPSWVCQLRQQCRRVPGTFLFQILGRMDAGLV